MNDKIVAYQWQRLYERTCAVMNVLWQVTKDKSEKIQASAGFELVTFVIAVKRLYQLSYKVNTAGRSWHLVSPTNFKKLLLILFHLLHLLSNGVQMLQWLKLQGSVGKGIAPNSQRSSFWTLILTFSLFGLMHRMNHG